MVCLPQFLTLTHLKKAGGVLVLLAIIAGSLSIPLGYWKAQAHYRAAQQALQQDHLLQAREFLENYLAYHPNSFSGHLLMARIARRGNYYAEAEVQLDICEILPGPPEAVYRERLLARVQKGDLSPEGTLVSQAQGDPDQAGEIYRALSQGYRKNYLLDKMRQCLDAWLEQEPGNSQALFRRAWVWERHQNDQAAIEDYQRALETDPDFHEARLRKAQLLLRQQPAEAVKDLEFLRQINPADPETGLALVQCWHNLGRSQEAQGLLKELSQAHPKDFPLLLEQGQLALKRGRLEQAENWLRRAVEQRPHDHQAHHALGQALSGQGKKQEAQKARARVKKIEADLELMKQLTGELQKRPNDPNLRCEIAKVFLRSGENNEALLWLNSALRADPNHLRSHLVLAQYYQKNHQPALAARHRQMAGLGDKVIK